MAQSWRVPHLNKKQPPKPLDAPQLQRLALDYVGRYATTRAKLASYLRRKIRERGWDGDDVPPTDSIVERFVVLGYINDHLFAESRADSMLRRGYGFHRITTALQQAGIDQDITQTLRQKIADGAIEAALAFARRKRIGPFSREPYDAVQRNRAFAALIRAGHSFDISQQILDADPTELD